MGNGGSTSTQPGLPHHSHAERPHHGCQIRCRENHSLTCRRRDLRAHIMGRLASEMIHFGMAIVENEKTINELVTTVYNYPSLHDLYKYACFDALGNLRDHKIKEF